MNVLSIVTLLMLLHTPPQKKVYEMRVTGYHVKADERGVLAEIIQPGRHASVSPGCIELLGEKVYVRGYGVFRVNDLTHNRLDDQFGICTMDLATRTKAEAQAIGNKVSQVVRILP